MRPLLILTMTGAFLGGVAWAADPAPGGGASKMPDFAEVDVNQNGLISQDEAERIQVVKAVFSKADADKNGTLSASEYGKVAGRKSG
jgi:hypothetical protein